MKATGSFITPEGWDTVVLWGLTQSGFTAGVEFTQS